MVHHVVVSALTMTKSANISMKTEHEALLLGTYIKQDIENTIIKEATVLITLILTMKN